MTFNIEPSSEFVRLTAEADALHRQIDNLNRQDPRSELWIETFGMLMRQLSAVIDALKATPEQQYIDQIRKDEFEADEQNMTAELARRGRMTTGLSLSPEGQSIDDAVMYQRFASVAVQGTPGVPLVIIADMQMMSAAQVVKCLRKMADHIEEDGIAVYHGPWPDDSESDWWVGEQVDGTLLHLHFRDGR